jgi:drug/metabolite transporter (DMT)-like permease
LSKGRGDAATSGGPGGKAWIAFATVCVVWGTTYLAIAIAIETLPTFLFPGVRFTLAGLILMALRLSAGDSLPRRRAEWLNLALIGVLMVGVGNVAVVYAEHHVSSGFAALLVATSPFWMALMETFRKTGERVNLRKALGMLVGFSGVALLVAPYLNGTFSTGFFWGVVALQLGSIAWNFGSIRSKYHAPRTTALMSAALQMLCGGIFVGLIGLLRGEAASFTFNLRTFLAFAYLVVFGSILAYSAYVYALSKLRTSVTSLYAFINPAVAVFLGWLILQEPFGWREFIAMLVIFAGVALVQTAPAQKPTDHEVTAPMAPDLDSAA